MGFSCIDKRTARRPPALTTCPCLGEIGHTANPGVYAPAASGGAKCRRVGEQVCATCFPLPRSQTSRGHAPPGLPVLCSEQHGREKQALFRGQPQNPPRLRGGHKRGPDLPRPCLPASAGLRRQGSTGLEVKSGRSSSRRRGAPLRCSRNKRKREGRKGPPLQSPGTAEERKIVESS